MQQRRRACFAMAMWLLSALPLAGQLTDSCMVSALNRTAPVQEDGVWVLPNVPANLGQVRVRATCVENGVVRFGASSLITIPTNGVIQIEEINFQGPPPVPASLRMAAPLTALTAVGQTVQLSAIATFPGGSTADVTAEETGTDYRTSNPAIATVDTNGLVTARASGVALVSAVNEGALGVIQIQVVASGDSDGDGLPDDWELANGLDPNNPVDALDDQDEDGLSTIAEYQSGLDPFNGDSDGDGLKDGREVNDLGTNPLLGDTDGDGLWDGLEVQTGSNPLDPSSFNLAAALQGITVAPESFTLVVNTIVREASQQVQVMGQLIDGRSLNITAGRYGTSYSSSNLAIANFGPEDGRIYAGQDGTATITVTNNGFSDTAQVTVQTFAPTALAWVDIPGHAKDVAVDGDYAYVAAGEAGLQVVDISDLEHPAVVASLDTAGDAQDIKIEGGTAFIADGSAGLVIIDVSSPLTPRLLGQVATPGVALDIAVTTERVYVADERGVRIVDITDLSSAALVGGIELPCKPNGVDVFGSIAVAACSNAVVQIVDLADPAAPSLLGSTNAWAADVSVRGNLAYLAGGGITVVDFHIPSNPVIVQMADWRAGFNFSELILDRGFAIAPDLQTPNAIAIFDISARPTLLAYMDLRPVSGGRGVYRHGLDVRDGVAFVTASSYPNQPPPEYSGLEIGRYAIPATGSGVPPAVRILEPAAGSTVEERARLRIRAEASDDVRVESVQFLINGSSVFTDFGPPYEANAIVPAGSSEARLRAVAVDVEGNRSVSEEVTIAVTPNSKPVVDLLAPISDQVAIAGNTLTLAADASDDRAVLRVEFFVNDTPVNADSAPPYRYDYTVPLGATQLAVRAVAYDNVGTSDPMTPVVIPVTPDLPPIVSIIQPLDGDLAVAGALYRVIANAADDVRVAEVRLLVDGVVEQTLQEPPFDFEPVAPLGANEIHLAAIARDNKGQETTSAEITLQLGGDPLTTATGTVLLSGGGPAAGATVTCQGLSGTTGGDGRFSIAGVPTTSVRIRCRARYTASDGSEFSGISASIEAVRGGITDVGEIELRPEAAFLYPGPQLTVYADGVKIADVNEDGIPDLVAGSDIAGVAVFLGTPNGGYEDVLYLETAGSRDVLVGDFNGDTHRDIATANGSSAGISVLLGNGDGTFQPHVESAPGTSPVALAAGDFNEDGQLDLVAAGGNLYVLLGNGTGAPTLAGSIAASGATSVEVGDANQDGHLDLLSAQRTQSNVKVFLGDGTGSFTLSRTVSSSTPDDLTVGNLDGDGRLDFATASASGDRVRVFFGQADGSYLTGPVLTTGWDPLGVIASDLDADGDLDLAAVNNGTNDLSLFLGNGSGSFSSGVKVFTGSDPNDLTAGDLNRDGIIDLVTANTLGLSLVYGLGNAAFDTDLRYPAGENPLGVTVADFNADGAQDVAVASNDSDEVAVLLGRGDGTFAAERRFPAGVGPESVAAADFNGDAKVDLVLGNPGADALNVLLGQGDGTFAPPSPYPVGDWPLALVATDLDGDGHVDLAAANSSSNDVSVLVGNGDGTFAPQLRYPVGDGPWALAVGDFQGDGHPDLVTANYWSEDLSLLSGNVAGTLDPELRLSLDMGQYPDPQAVVATDLDDDGREDLVVSYLFDDNYDYFHGILLGRGDGTFQPLQVTPAGPNAFGLMIVADANGDGIPDIVSTSPGGAATQDLLMVLGQGDGIFSAPQRYVVTCYPFYLAAGDFNGDGQVDFVTTNGCGDNDVSILIHH